MTIDSSARPFLAGVIEGFYGEPWSQAERLELFERMAAWRLNTYLYAPKDDPWHRARWRELYETAAADGLRDLIAAAASRDIAFFYGISPGLDMRYSLAADFDRLCARLDQMLALGCNGFALLFDDIPDVLDRADLDAYGSLASAQCHVANAAFAWLRARRPAARVLFCPTPYCGRMAAEKLGGDGYLETTGRELHSEIDVFWTGPRIVSHEIGVEHVRGIASVLRRKPIIWDNLHANDYDRTRFFCGPYSGRPIALRDEVAGLMSNPNNEWPMNFVPLRTLAAFVHARDSYDPRTAYLEAMREWAATGRAPVASEDLVAFGDRRYLPHADGPEAHAPRIRRAGPGDEPGAYHVCLKTGNYGADAEALHAADPDALGRLYVGPYLAFERDLGLILEDEQGICGYALGALDSHAFYARYEAEWRTRLCAQFAAPRGDRSQWTPVESVYYDYHHPDYFCPDPYDRYPSHLHIDLLPRAQGRGYGRRMIDDLIASLRARGSPGVHLGVSAQNVRARAFYEHLGFRELTRTGSGGDAVVYMGKSW